MYLSLSCYYFSVDPSSPPGAMSGTNGSHWNPLGFHFAPLATGLLIHCSFLSFLEGMCVCLSVVITFLWALLLPQERCLEPMNPIGIHWDPTLLTLLQDY